MSKNCYFEKFYVTFLLHLSIAVLGSLVLRSFLPNFFLTPLLDAIVLCLSFIASLCLSQKMFYENKKAPKKNLLTIILSIALILFFLKSLTYLLFHSTGIWYVNHKNNVGDLLLHVNYIRVLIGENPLTMDNPIFLGKPWLYPWGMDLYNSLWENCGLRTQTHLFFTAFLASCCAIYFLNSYIGWLGLIGLFLSGGLLNWKILFGGDWSDAQNFLQWKNFLTSIWLTQRGFLFALPAGIYLLYKMKNWIEQTKVLQKNKPLIICLNILGMALPFFHLHSFLFISLVILTYAIYMKSLWSLIKYFYPVIIASSLCFLRIFYLTDIDSFFKIHLSWDNSWMKENNLSIIKSWFFNLGPWLLLWMGSLVYLLVSKKWETIASKIFLMSSLGFLLMNFVQIAPWFWDNIKILIWFYILVLWSIWKLWVQRLSLIKSSPLMLILGFSGFISLINVFPFPYGKGLPIISREEVYTAQKLLRDISKDAVFYIAPDPHHPLIWLGRKVVMGHPFNLWTHGVSYKKRLNELKFLFQKGKNITQDSKEGDYLFFGPREKKFFNVKNISLSEDEWEKLSKIQGVALFRRKKMQK